MSVHKGYEKGFDICLDYGQDGERRVDDLLARLYAGEKCEVKTDDRWFDTGNLYIEYECRGRDGQWRPSGIATSTAEMWAFVFSDTGVVLFIPKDALLYIARKAWREGQRREHGAGQNPTRGVVISMSDLPALVGGLPFTETVDTQGRT